MSTSRLIRHSVRTMGRYKLRTAFMMLGTLIGVAALTLVVSIGRGAERQVLSTVKQIFGASGILVMGGGGLMMGGPHAGGARLTIDDMEAVAKEVAGIESWDPQRGISRASVRRGDVSSTPRVVGASERSGAVWDRKATRGEYFSATDVLGSARVAVIGETVVRELFGTEDPIGGDLQINSVPFKVVGVLESWGTDLHGMDRDNEIVVPITTAMRRLANADTIGGAKVNVVDPAEAETVAREIRRVLRERHGLAEGQADDFRLMTPIEVQQMVGWVTRILNVYLPLVAVVALLVAAIVAASLMLVSVNERTAEIGLRRALGARAEDIRLQFLLETAAITLCGGLAGMVVGYIGAQMVALHYPIGNIFSWTAMAIGFAASALTGLVAGVLPARRAARLQPVDALR